MKVFYLCDPRRNTTCGAVCRVEGDTLACMNSNCKSTTKIQAARRFLGIPLVNLPFMLRWITNPKGRVHRRFGGGGGNNKKKETLPHERQ